MFLCALESSSIYVQIVITGTWNGNESREHPASLSLSSVISIDRSSNDLSSTQSSYKSAPRQPKQLHHLLRTSAPLAMVAASPSPLGEGSSWNCQPHPISAVDGHTGQLPPAIPTINDPAADGWSRENLRVVRAIAWLAHRSVPLFPIKYLVPPTYLPRRHNHCSK